jgi:hypothetical protein
LLASTRWAKSSQVPGLSGRVTYELTGAIQPLCPAGPRSGDGRGIDAAPGAPGGECRLARETLVSVEAPTGKALARARRPEQGTCRVACCPEEGVGRCHDVGERATAYERGHVVVFQTDGTEPFAVEGAT